MSGTRSVRARLALILVTLVATACANSLTSYRTERFGRDGPAVITQDAKTRHLVMVPEQTDPRIPGAPDARENQWRVCAEAAPDVFNAMSTSAAARFGLNLRNSNAETNAEGAMALAEVAGTIERTAYINMLREAMYRTCERYLSGAISRAAFVVQAGRDWRMMLYGLTIQQLTQNIRPPSTILAPPTTQASLAPADREKLQQAQERLRNATKALREAEDRPHDKCTGSGGGEATEQPVTPVTQPATPVTEQTETPGTQPATPVTEQPQTSTQPGQGGQTQQTETPAPTGPTPEEQAACEAREQAITRAREDQDMAKAEIASFGVPVNGTGAETGSVTGNAGNGGGQLSAATLAAVTPVIQQIVKAVADTDETQLLCLQVLAEGDRLLGSGERLSDGESVRSMCLRYLAARVGADTQRLAGYQVSQPMLDTLSVQMRIVETYLGQEPGTPGERWNALVLPLASRFQFNPITVPANATMEQIRAQMRRLPGELETIVALINQGGS